MLIDQTASQSSLGGSLEAINNAHTKAYIPVIIFVVCVVVVGFTTNVLAFIFFSKKATKSSFHYFISAISLNDALANLAMIQDSVALFHYINNDNSMFCKLHYFFIHSLVGNSLLLIVAISVDRLRRVVCPFARQVTLKMARNIVVGISLFSFSLSVHHFYTCSIEHIAFQTRNNLTVVGYMCARSKEYPQATVNKLFHYIYICCHILSVGFLIISYTIIVKKLILLRNKVKSKIDLIAHRKNRQEGPSSMATVDSKPSGSNIDVNRKRDPSGLSETERAFSITAFVITVASIICFVPYYVNISLIEPNVDGTSLVFSVVHMFIRRFFMLNSTVNPFIMFYFNPAFRKFVVNILCCLCQKIRKL